MNGAHPAHPPAHTEVWLTPPQGDDAHHHPSPPLGLQPEHHQAHMPKPRHLARPPPRPLHGARRLRPRPGPRDENDIAPQLPRQCGHLTMLPVMLPVMHCNAAEPATSAARARPRARRPSSLAGRTTPRSVGRRHARPRARRLSPHQHSDGAHLCTAASVAHQRDAHIGPVLAPRDPDRGALLEDARPKDRRYLAQDPPQVRCTPYRLTWALFV